MKRNIRRRDARSGQRGFTLVEGLIAVLLFSVGILGMVALQANAVRATTQSKYRIDASFLANSLVARMWVDQANIGSYVGADVPVPELPNGTRTVSIAGDEVTVTYSWRLPGASETNKLSVLARVTGAM